MPGFTPCYKVHPNGYQLFIKGWKEKTAHEGFSERVYGVSSSDVDVFGRNTKLKSSAELCFAGCASKEFSDWPDFRIGRIVPKSMAFFVIGLTLDPAQGVPG